MDFGSMWDRKAKEGKKVIGIPDELPEGLYEVKVLVCKFGETKTGKSMVFWDLEVAVGQQKGNHIHVYRTFSKTEDTEENRKAIDSALDDFKQLGLDATRAAIARSMINLIGKVIEIKLVKGTNGNFRNFKRIIDTPAALEVVLTVDAELIQPFVTTMIPDEPLPF